MKEHIHTIPLSEAMEADSECVFCTIEQRLEQEAVEYALGASMMEPDSRIQSNQRGFCRRHYHMMSQKNNALSLALVLDTHLDELRRRLSEVEQTACGSKPGLFKKAGGTSEACAQLEDLLASCVICDKLNDTMTRYAGTFWQLYDTEPDFRQKVQNGKGFCLPHLSLLLQAAAKEPRHAQKHLPELFALEQAQLERMNGEVNWFTKKFDYRYHDQPWNNAKDAPQRCMDKLAKWIGEPPSISQKDSK